MNETFIDKSGRRVRGGSDQGPCLPSRLASPRSSQDLRAEWAPESRVGSGKAILHPTRKSGGESDTGGRERNMFCLPREF